MMILITIPWFTPAYRAGGPVQSILNLVRNFNEGVEFRIFCSNKDLNGETLTVETDCWTAFNDHTQVWYASEEVSKTMTGQAEKLKPDVLFIIGLFSWHYNIVPLLFCKAPLKILSARGMLHAGALAQKRFKKQVFLTALKMAGISRKVVFHATDTVELDFIKATFGNDAKVAIAQNYGRKVTAFDPPEKQPGRLKLITIAIISPMKNYLKVLEALAKTPGNIEYDIYGPVKDNAYWEFCREQIRSLPENIIVRYHGETEPNTVDKLLSESHVFIMPSESENFGHSIYEALSAGRPVITGKTTPWNNLLPAKAGINVSADTEEIKNAISLFVSMDNEEYKSFSAGAKNYIEQHTNEKEIDLQYRRLFHTSE
jgi:glycosyltransferase involved in cell wall biosynthesis